MSGDVIYTAKDMFGRIDAKLDSILVEVHLKADRSDVEVIISNVDKNGRRLTTLETRDEFRKKQIEDLFQLDRSRSKLLVGFVMSASLAVLGFALAVLAGTGGLP